MYMYMYVCIFRARWDLHASLRNGQDSKYICMFTTRMYAPMDICTYFDKLRVSIYIYIYIYALIYI